jgi:hypothetical protein
MAAAEYSIEIGALAPPRLRHKSTRRRLGHDLRFSAPFAAVGFVFLVTLGFSKGVERLTPVNLIPAALQGVAQAELAYSPTISISSTSNVSAAPPGMVAGDPLSP